MERASVHVSVNTCYPCMLLCDVCLNAITAFQCACIHHACIQHQHGHMPCTAPCMPLYHHPLNPAPCTASVCMDTPCALHALHVGSWHTSMHAWLQAAEDGACSACESMTCTYMPPPPAPWLQAVEDGAGARQHRQLHSTKSKKGRKARPAAACSANQGGMQYKHMQAHMQ